MKKAIILLIGSFFILFPETVSAHAFGAVYTLPLPFWLYLYGGIGALLLSFLLIGFFYHTRNSLYVPKVLLTNVTFNHIVSSQYFLRCIKGFSVFLLIFSIASGIVGEDISSFNFVMPFFWIIFVIGFTYLTFLFGNIWEIGNPWKVLLEFYEYYTKKHLNGVIAYPKNLGYFPAFILYMVFICIELLGATTPFSLAIFLIQYSLITFFFSFIFGKKDWFTYGEFFSVFFLLISYCSPLQREGKRYSITLPFSQILKRRAKHVSQILFVLAMLSSTAFDGLRETNIWYSVYWDIFEPLLGAIGYPFYDLFGLLVSPFVFFIFYFICIWLMKMMTKTKKNLSALSLDFAFTLIPIALVYNVAHYFTLLVLQGPLLIRLISDPFGFGWNLFGTGTFVPDQTLLSAAFVWHFQVVVILLGHIVSVVLAHSVALQIFSKQKKVMVSQIPMLLLMVLYTVAGLWILSQPIGITP